MNYRVFYIEGGELKTRDHKAECLHDVLLYYPRPGKKDLQNVFIVTSTGKLIRP